VSIRIEDFSVLGYDAMSIRNSYRSLRIITASYSSIGESS